MYLDFIAAYFYSEAYLFLHKIFSIKLEFVVNISLLLNTLCTIVLTKMNIICIVCRKKTPISDSGISTSVVLFDVLLSIKMHIISFHILYLMHKIYIF